MNEIVNKFLIAADKCMPKIHLRQGRFASSACWLFAKKQRKNTKIKKKQEIHDIFIKTNQTKFFFNMTGLMEVLKI